MTGTSVKIALAVGLLAAAVVCSTASSTDSESSPGVSYLNELENEILREHNLVRTDPAAYSRYLAEWLPHYKGKVRRLPGRMRVLTVEGKRGVISAIRFLESQPPVAPLQPSRGLSRAANDHVDDTGGKGWMGHLGSDDSEPGDRASRYGTWYRRVGENITYGGWTPRELILRLIIDDGVPDRGHRHNLFNPEFSFAGIAFGHHREYGSMCVISYAADYEEH